MEAFNFFGVQRRALHLMLALDCSNSMRGEKIKSLNYAMRAALPAMRNAAEDNPEADVFLRILRFGDVAAWLGPAIALHEAQWHDLEAEGLTSLGGALTLLAQELTPERLSGRILPPIVILVSDGQPTDDYRAGFAAFEAAPLIRSGAARMAIAIGADVDRQILQRFMGEHGGPPLEARDAGELVNRMRWASSVTIQAASRPALRSVLTQEEVAKPAGDPFIWDG